MKPVSEKLKRLVDETKFETLARLREECAATTRATIPESIRPFVEALGRVPSPAEAVDLFCTALRTEPARKEKLLLERGTPFEIENRGDRIFGWTWGEGPPVVFVHGWSGRAAQLMAFIEAAEAVGLKAIALDLPGHGISEGTLTHGFRVAECLRTLDARFGPLHGLVAYSFGSAGSTVAMSEGLRVRRAVYLAPMCYIDLRTEQFARAVGVTDWEAFWKAVEDRFSAGRLEWVGGDRRGPLIQTPLRIYHDADDTDLPISHSRSLAVAWQNAELIETEKLGHARIIRSDAVVAGAMEFLTG
jgi:pimeloyl-ACP methyl ester carboxylesterase